MDKRWDKAKQQLAKLRFCPAKAEATVRVIHSKIYAGALYGVEAASATPAKVASLTVAVGDVFKSRNNNHNANQFFSTIVASKSDLDPVAQICARRVLQIRRTTCKKAGTGERFKTILTTYATRHKRTENGRDGTGNLANKTMITPGPILMNNRIHPPMSTTRTGTKILAQWDQ